MTRFLRRGRARRDTTKSTPSTIAIIIAILTVIGTIITAIISSPHLFKKSPPEFELSKGTVYHPDSTIVVCACNSAASNEQPIILEIDGYLQHHAAQPIREANSIIWYIHPSEYNIPVECLADGKHVVRFGFSDQHLSRKYPVVFDTKQPSGRVRYESESPNSKRITGRVIDEGVVDEQNISVEVAFKYQQRLETTHLPVKTYIDSVSGQRMYEFEYCIQNLPQISRDSSAYREPFFALQVKDQAGNAFRHTASYNTFMAEGVQTFQTTSADIIMQRVEQVESPVQETRISVKHQPPPQKKIAAGPPPITLRVLIRSPKQVVLSYTRLKPELRSDPEQYVVLKKNQEIGVSYDTTYSDRTVAADSTYHYQVLAKGIDGIYYPSNIATAEPFSEPEPPPAPLRSIPTELSEEQVTKMIVDRKFYDQYYNKNGPGFQNRFETKTLNDDKVVYDHATGLMWQQGGSKERMKYEDARKWIDQLNVDKFAGFKDWRLPTLEEAMSLMEPEKRNGDLYIDPLFDAEQTWIWTADPVKGESWAWFVNFYSGGCYYDYLTSSNYVRAVRSGQSSTE